MIVEPIDGRRREQVCRATDDCIRRAEHLFDLRPQRVPVVFDLQGKAAGMYRVRGGARLIRYNPYIFAKYFQDSLDVTIPHEVAHYVTDRLYGLRNVRPHGREWKTVMAALGADARVSAPYDLVGVPVRRQRRFTYQCGCRTHQLTSCRHNRVSRGQAAYVCRRCGSAIVPLG